MRLVSLTVKDFRSITNGHKLQFGDSTVLIGPNNEGKSNIVRALVAGLRILSTVRRAPESLRTAGATTGMLLSNLGVRRYYNWETDFPIGKRKRRKGEEGSSELLFEFSLEPEEVDEFRKSIKSSLNGNLPIRLSLGRVQSTIAVVKQGVGSKVLAAKTERIQAFIRSRIGCQYIPSVRTAESVHSIVEETVEAELQAVEKNPNYQAALEAIALAQQPILDRVSEGIKATLLQFLPGIRDVQVRITAQARTEALRRASEIIVDDGTPTLLAHKGDGVQSLAALALMRHASQEGAGKQVIVAVEEPESHLHPSAIHGLRSVLSQIATQQQVVITTHCPLFVDRNNISTNILVSKNRARPASNIAEIRESLGVRASDNLRHAECILLLEGEDDRISVTALLRHRSEVLRRALTEGTLVIDTLSGASNLAYKASLVLQALCACHCYLDHDKAGLDAFDRARTEKLLNDSQVTFSICNGMPEAELEDLFERTTYESAVLSTFGVSLNSPAFRGNKKWSDRVRSVFLGQGKPWSARVEGEVKRVVANAVSTNPEGALHVQKA